MAESTLEKLPTPDEVHEELAETLRHAENLRKLFRLAQRAEDRRKKAAATPAAESEVARAK